MNIFKKAYCRIFQFCFWAVYPLLPYREPELVENGLEGLSSVIKKENKQHKLTDKRDGNKRSKAKAQD